MLLLLQTPRGRWAATAGSLIVPPGQNPVIIKVMLRRSCCGGLLLLATIAGCARVGAGTPRADGAADGLTDGLTDVARRDQGAADVSSAEGRSDSLSDLPDGPLPEQNPPPLCRYGTGGWLFGDVIHVSELSSAYDDSDLSFTADSQTVYFSSERQGGAGQADIYVAHRPSRAAPFGQVTNLSALNSAYSDKSFAITQDGLTAYFSSNRPGGPGTANIWSGSRPSTQYPWSSEMFTVNTSLSTTAADFDPVLPGAGLRLYYAIFGWSVGEGAQILTVAERQQSTEAFGPPQLIAELDSPYFRADPTLTDAELVMAFYTDQPGGPGDDDLWYAVRPSLGAAFGAPEPLPGVNSVYRDLEPTFTPDGCELFFGSMRPGGLGSADIYRVQVLEGP